MKMTSRRGTLLEKNVEQLLKLSGFNPQVNKIYNGYEIDVFFTYKNLKIAFECKQYERSTLAIRNLIHQWDSKNKELNFDRIIIVLVGCDISSNDYQLAKKYGILIWDEQKLTNLLDRAIEEKIENKNTILKELGVIDEIKDVEKVDLEIEIEETEQQNIIKQAFDDLLRRGSRDLGFVIFEEKRTDFFVQWSLDENGFGLCFPESPIADQERLEKVRMLLLSLKFQEIPHIKKGLLIKREEPSKDLMELKEKEFIIIFESYGEKCIYAKCGEDTKFASYLTDRIFRGVFGAKENYKLKVEISYE
jgi:hypothetical protein